MKQSPIDQHTNFNRIYQCYRTLISVNVSEYESNKTHLVFPIMPITLINSLCATAYKIFQEEPTVLRLSTSGDDDIIIVGDLHGQILDLFRVLKQFGHPPKKRYLFLGDIVDRGEFSTETLIMIMLMKVLFPNHVYVIRGNHEFSTMWKSGGFASEIALLYGSSNMNNYNDNIVASEFSKMLSTVPLGAVIDEKIFCVHGGIGPQFESIKQLEDIHRPVHEYDFEPLISAVWSDPFDEIDTYKNSPRGSGYLFGEKAITKFLDDQGLDVLVRGHQSISEGVAYHLNGKCITVFTASNYCGQTPNMAGILILKHNQTPQPITFPPIVYIKRDSATFLQSSSETTFQLSSKPAFSIPRPSTSISPTKPRVNKEEHLPPIIPHSPGNHHRHASSSLSKASSANLSLPTYIPSSPKSRNRPGNISAPPTNKSKKHINLDLSPASLSRSSPLLTNGSRPQTPPKDGNELHQAVLLKKGKRPPTSPTTKRFSRTLTNV